MTERLTERHCGVAVIKDKSKLKEAMEKLAVYEDTEEQGLPLVETPIWIPCSERLPENNNPCLCWVKSTTIAAGEAFIIGSCERGFWFLQTYEIGHHHFPVKDYKVVAWMPLPKSYKGE